MIPIDPVPLPPLGRVVFTCRAAQLIPEEDALSAIKRFARGAWGGDFPEATEIERALDVESQLLSVHHASNGVTFWVVTEADRSLTTVLLPDEY